MARIATPHLTFPDRLFNESPNEFAALTSDSFGGGFVDDDGDDALILTIANALEADTAALPDLDQALADASFVAGAFEGANISPLITDAGDTISSGNSQLDDVITSVTPPQG